MSPVTRRMSSLTLHSTVKMSSGYELPRLGFGMLNNDNPAPAIHAALKAGYRHIDGAQFYKNEKQIGEALRGADVPRSEIFVTSKLMPGTLGYEATAANVDASLKEFGFDYLDMYLVHEPMAGPEGRMPKYQAVIDAQKAGKIRTFGVSNYGVKHLQEIKDAGLPLPAVNQIELHPFNQQKPIVEWCENHGVVVEAYCPLVQGKMDDPVIQALAKKYHREPAQILIRWSLQKGFVPLPKSATPSRIESNTKVFDFELSPEDMHKLDALDKGKAGSIMWDPVDHE